MLGCLMLYLMCISSMLLPAAQSGWTKANRVQSSLLRFKFSCSFTKYLASIQLPTSYILTEKYKSNNWVILFQMSTAVHDKIHNRPHPPPPPPNALQHLGRMFGFILCLG